MPSATSRRTAAPTRSSFARPSAASARRSRSAAAKGHLVFERRNYILLLLSIALILVGYMLMAWENEVDGVLSLYVSPILLVIGYSLVVYAILWRPRRPEAVSTPPANQPA